MASPAPRPYRLLSAGNVALVSAAVILTTTVAVWLLGLGQHRTMFANSLISTSILFAAFFLFTTVGLYHGVKLHDDVGRITDRIKRVGWPSNFENLPTGNFDLPHADGIGSLLVAIVVGLLSAVVALALIWLVGALLWTGVLIFSAMLYWVFFRALRLVFKNSNRCRGRLGASLWEGFWYASLYTCWIYGIIMAAHYLR
jgi:hypothetical protein